MLTAEQSMTRVPFRCLRADGGESYVVTAAAAAAAIQFVIRYQVADICWASEGRSGSAQTGRQVHLKRINSGIPPVHTCHDIGLYALV